MMKLLTFACLTVLAASAAPALSHPQDACKPSAGGCCDFTGDWWNEKPTANNPDHEFTQSNCTISFYAPNCGHGSSAKGTASGDTLTADACSNFYGGKLTGKLTLNTKHKGWNGTYDVLKWSNGAGWSRVSKPPVVV
jgi:hypothetical protein